MWLYMVPPSCARFGRGLGLAFALRWNKHLAEQWNPAYQPWKTLTTGLKHCYFSVAWRMAKDLQDQPVYVTVSIALIQV